MSNCTNTDENVAILSSACNTIELRDKLEQIFSLPPEDLEKIESIEFELSWIPSLKGNIVLKK